jgi:hypothetical protein
MSEDSNKRQDNKSDERQIMSEEQQLEILDRAADEERARAEEDCDPWFAPIGLAQGTAQEVEQ